jgi:hypothetical protein
LSIQDHYRKNIAAMNESTIKKLREENEHLRSCVMSLSATLLRKISVRFETHGPLGRADTERLVHEAEDCFRCAKIFGLRSEIAQGLEVAGHELMALAVEIETRLQRDRGKV